MLCRCRIYVLGCLTLAAIGCGGDPGDDDPADAVRVRDGGPGGAQDGWDDDGTERIDGGEAPATGQQPDPPATPDGGASCAATEGECGNNQDDDCDGDTDSHDSDCQMCAPNETQDCMTDQPGACAQGSQQCVLKAGGVWDWNDCHPAIEPASMPENCAGGQDQDCDGHPPAADPDCFCKNEGRDGDETDVDCGGSCNPCAAGRTCMAPKDCASKRCQGPTVSGGCVGFESVRRVLVRDGKLFAMCAYEDSALTQREIVVSGVTFSGGCIGLETSDHVFARGGKLMVDCVQSFGDSPAHTAREIVLDGATFSGGCEGFDVLKSIFVREGKLIARCAGGFDGSGPLSDKPFVFSGPNRCQ